MGSLFRSEEMTLCQLFLQTESAYACVAELGELGSFQFRDLNINVNAFQRKFVNEVKRCDEMERVLKFMDREAKRENIPLPSKNDHIEAPLPKEMIDLEATFERLETELRDVNANSVSLKKSFLELTELKHVLRKTQTFFDEQDHNNFEADTSQKHLVSSDPQSNPLSFVTGVILRERLQPFEVMLWRVCRGNALLKRADIETPLEDPITGDNVNKSVFIIFCQGEQLKSKIKKICDGFRAVLYPCPSSPGDRREMANGVCTRLEDLKIVLKQTEDHRRRVLIASAKHLHTWFVKVRKIKAVYHTMNCFNIDVTQKCLIAEGWCAVNDLNDIQLALQRGTDSSGSAVPSIINRMTTKENPPTFNRTNKFTSGFQAIVDAYGVADYREVNPAPFTIVTFPFLFAVMFGDCGHGLIMAAFALWMVLKERSLAAEKSNNEIWNTFFNGRYIILLMGTFSIYTGLIYNDVFSKSFNIFGSSWSVPMNTPDVALLVLDPNKTYYGHPYPFGIDPVWALTANKILFLNSYKMKVSIVLGVTQMVFGVVLSIWNHLYFKNHLNIICEFIPQLIFLLAIFGYLVVLIFHKWIYYSCLTTQEAPSLLIHLINMFLFSYPTSPPSLAAIYPGQQVVQSILVILAVICIPWMLFVKPFVLRSRAKKQETYLLQNVHVVNVPENGELVVNDIHSDTAEPVDSQEDSHGGHGGPFNFGDIFIHQAIHTIEYCLGSISHTASYLRLWALSLAHAQLSEVLWTMVMIQAFGTTSYVGCILFYVIFAAWGCLTIGILLVMEGLSAFLHALRLHWVEFQSKFYAGSGYAFAPFSFKVFIDQGLNEE